MWLQMVMRPIPCAVSPSDVSYLEAPVERSTRRKVGLWHMPVPASLPLCHHWPCVWPTKLFQGPFCLLAKSPSFWCQWLFWDGGGCLSGVQSKDWHMTAAGSFPLPDYILPAVQKQSNHSKAGQLSQPTGDGELTGKRPVTIDLNSSVIPNWGASL